MVVDYLTRAGKLVSLGVLWLLSAVVLCAMLFGVYAASVGFQQAGDKDPAAVFGLIVGVCWVIAGFWRVGWSACVLRDGFATYRAVLTTLALRFVAGCGICVGALIGGLGCRWLSPAAAPSAVQLSFAVGGLVGFGFGGLLGFIHDWRVREQGG